MADSTGRSDDSLAKAFDTAMFSIYERALGEARYPAVRFLQMLNEHGGVETANRLLPSMSQGFEELWNRKRLDLTMEALIIRAQWRSLFTPEQLKIAEDRLRDCGYAGPWS
jgi:hypothetical protein